MPGSDTSLGPALMRSLGEGQWPFIYKVASIRQAHHEAPRIAIGLGAWAQLL